MDPWVKGAGVTDDRETKSMPPTAGSSVPPEPASFQLNPGDRVGNYVIREQIGEGGFAIVYAAEQEKPVRRKVALKIIKLGMDTKQVIARFEAERQALAMMDHPNVAKVFDAGSTDAGRPFFVMEHVAGESITEYCDKQRLTIEDRLGLLAQVCEGVQHAHQKGIIHRDIKPSNVLVTVKEGKPQVKVIDFGVAKAITQRLTEKTIYTEQGQLIGTPEYMSPEQAEMTTADIDTRSDIYSLGVLLYELLTGSLPFDPTTLRQAAFGEIQRIIREDEPPKPSTRLSSLGDDSATSAKRRRVDPKTLAREVRGDLDWIVMKALEKDRGRRYETASDLARDIQRHLVHEPVWAGPPSSAYRVRKFVRRNRVAVASTTVVAFALLAGGVGTAIGLTQAAIERSQRVSEIRGLTAFLLDIDEASANLESSPTWLGELLGRVQERLDTLSKKIQDPELLGELAYTYERLGDVTGHPDVQSQGDPVGAIASYQQALMIRLELHRTDPNSSAARQKLARLYYTLGQVSAAAAADSLAGEQQRLMRFEEARSYFEACYGLGEFRFLHGNPAAIEELVRRKIEDCREAIVEFNPPN